MGIDDKIKYARLSELHLDPLNPRLGRNQASPDLSQPRVLELMSDWTLDELGVSFLESGGFWPQEALVVTQERLKGKNCLVVIEGNRRLAALILLKKAIDGKLTNTRWKEIAKIGKPNRSLFSAIPYISVGSRKEVEAFIGFRHVTGIKQWNPAEKAEYITKLIDDGGYSYEQVRRKIGSKTPTVRQNYIAYRMLIQIENVAPSVPVKNVEERFSVMFLSLRTKGVQQYLQIDIQADPRTAKRPIPRTKLKSLANFALWHRE